MPMTKQTKNGTTMEVSTTDESGSGVSHVITPGTQPSKAGEGKFTGWPEMIRNKNLGNDDSTGTGTGTDNETNGVAKVTPAKETAGKDEEKKDENDDERTEKTAEDNMLIENEDGNNTNNKKENNEKTKEKEKEQQPNNEEGKRSVLPEELRNKEVKNGVIAQGTDFEVVPVYDVNPGDDKYIQVNLKIHVDTDDGKNNYDSLYTDKNKKENGADDIAVDHHPIQKHVVAFAAKVRKLGVKVMTSKSNRILTPEQWDDPYSNEQLIDEYEYSLIKNTEQKGKRGCNLQVILFLQLGKNSFASFKSKIIPWLKKPVVGSTTGWWIDTVNGPTKAFRTSLIGHFNKMDPEGQHVKETQLELQVKSENEFGMNREKYKSVDSVGPGSFPYISLSVEKNHVLVGRRKMKKNYKAIMIRVESKHKDLVRSVLTKVFDDSDKWELCDHALRSDQHSTNYLWEKMILAHIKHGEEVTYSDVTNLTEDEFNYVKEGIRNVNNVVAFRSTSMTDRQGKYRITINKTMVKEEYDELDKLIANIPCDSEYRRLTRLPKRWKPQIEKMDQTDIDKKMKLYCPKQPQKNFWNNRTINTDGKSTTTAVTTSSKAELCLDMEEKLVNLEQKVHEATRQQAAEYERLKREQENERKHHRDKIAKLEQEVTELRGSNERTESKQREHDGNLEEYNMRIKKVETDSKDIKKETEDLATKVDDMEKSLQPMIAAEMNGMKKEFKEEMNKQQTERKQEFSSLQEMLRQVLSLPQPKEDTKRTRDNNKGSPSKGSRKAIKNGEGTTNCARRQVVFTGGDDDDIDGDDDTNDDAENSNNTSFVNNQYAALMEDEKNKEDDDVGETEFTGSDDDDMDDDENDMEEEENASNKSNDDY